MTRKLRIASVSFLSRPDPLANLEAGLDWIDEAASQQADLIVFPENFLYHRTHIPAEEIGEPYPGPLTGQLAARAAESGMCSVIPSYERDGQLLYNTAAVFERDGRLAGKYRKTHLTLPELDDGLLPGMELPVFDLSIGRLAVLICYDFWFPEASLVYARKQAEIICLADMKAGPSLYDIMLRLQGTAAMTQCHIVQAQFSQEPPYAPYAGRHTTGRACVVGPDGIILADTGHRPGLAVATVDLDEPRLTKDAAYYGDRVNFRAALSNWRRPELYSELARPRHANDRVDSRLKRALDRVGALAGSGPYAGTPFCPEESADDPEIFPPADPRGESSS
jgi:predicted amidohydrolase